MQVFVKLTSDQIDDLIYYSRAGDLPSLKDEVQTLSGLHSCPHSHILSSVIDTDQDGLGTRSSLLHYPAANGSLEIVNYLLSCMLRRDTGSITSTTIESTSGASNAGAPARALTDLVNHKNISGNTPLHWAGMNGHLDVVKALLRAGADPGIINEAGRDAVVESEWSAKEGAAECAVWMLKECGALEKGVSDETEDYNASTHASQSAGDDDDDDDEQTLEEQNGEQDPNKDQSATLSNL